MESGYLNKFSDALRHYREYNGLTVAQFASELSISADSLSDLERAVTVPTLSTLRSMARLVAWTYEELGSMILSLRSAPRRLYVEARDGE